MKNQKNKMKIGFLLEAINRKDYVIAEVIWLKC